MECLMKLSGSGLAFKLGNSGFGLNVSTGIHVAILRPGDGKPFVFTIRDTLSAGSASGTLAVAYLDTDWFPVNSDVCSWAAAPELLIGKRIDIEMKGTVPGAGKVDIQINVLDYLGNKTTFLNVGDVRAKGFQLTSLSVRGDLIRWPDQIVNVM